MERHHGILSSRCQQLVAFFSLCKRRQSSLNLQKNFVCATLPPKLNILKKEIILMMMMREININNLLLEGGRVLYYSFMHFDTLERNTECDG